MGVLFSDKCSQKGLLIYSSDYDEEMGNVSDTFILWCQKLVGLDEMAFKRGISALEARQMKVYAEGGEMWPPSYSEFAALCIEPDHKDSWRAYKPFDSSRAVEDKTARKKRYEQGVKQCSELLKLLGD